jgi:hypothetical protein
MSKKKQGTQSKEKSRHIPTDVSNEVEEQHFFECAWCSTNLTERHHIEPYHLGGKHTVENLILLCPNCHTQLHSGKITDSELRVRKSTHLKGDRIEGNFSFTLDKPIFKLGGVRIINTHRILVYKGATLIDWEKNKRGDFMLSVRLFDRGGNLIFWMANNRYWAPSTFKIERQNSSLHISCVNTPFFDIKFLKLGDELLIYGLTYLHNTALLLLPEILQLGNGNLIRSGTIEDCGSGILIG